MQPKNAQKSVLHEAIYNQTWIRTFEILRCSCSLYFISILVHTPAMPAPSFTLNTFKGAIIFAPWNVRSNLWVLNCFFVCLLTWC